MLQCGGSSAILLIVAAAMCIGCDASPETVTQTECPEPPPDEPAETPDAGPLPLVCAGLARGIYPATYRVCSEDFEGLPVPFLCTGDGDPPADACQPLRRAVHRVGEEQYYCCCDPQATEACDFYEP